MMNRLLMGIDVGSTNIKAAVFTEQGTEIASHTVPNIPRQMDPEHESWLFWDPEELWGKVKQCMRECVKNSSSAGPVAAVAVTGMGMDGLPLDQEGNWLYPFISWKCSRTASTMEYWSQKLGTDKIFQISGKQPMAIDTLYRILWFREHKPELYGQTWKWLQIEDYINYKLSGCVVTDYSMASCTSLLDQRTRAWSKELLEAAGVKEEILPDIRASGSCIGTVSEETAKETGISPGAMVVLGGTTTPAPPWPQGCWSRGRFLTLQVLGKCFTPVPAWKTSPGRFKRTASNLKATFCRAGMPFLQTWFPLRCWNGSKTRWSAVRAAAAMRCGMI